jgi:hypothetical protein
MHHKEIKSKYLILFLSQSAVCSNNSWNEIFLGFVGLYEEYVESTEISYVMVLRN